MVDLTSGSWATGTGITGVRPRHTLLVLADITMVAVRVYLALRSTAGDGVWLRDQTREAVTNRVSCPVRLAGGARSTGRGVARVWLLHTPVVLAHLSVRAVGVRVALIVTASDGVRLGNKARLTLADSIVVSIDGASSVRATWMRLAWVLEVEKRLQVLYTKYLLGQ